jgi:hypothetical protein
MFDYGSMAFGAPKLRLLARSLTIEDHSTMNQMSASIISSCSEAREFRHLSVK